MSIRTPNRTLGYGSSMGPMNQQSDAPRSESEPVGTSYWRLLKETFSEWSEDRVPRLGAALAFYAFFSIGPLLYIAVFIAATVYGNTVGQAEQAKADFHQQMSEYVGAEAAGTIVELSENARRSRSGFVGTIMSIVGLLFAATGAVVALKDALNTIWGVAQPPGTGIWATVRDRFLSLIIVAVVGTLMIFSLALSTFMVTAADTALGWLPFQMPIAVAQVVNYVVTFIVITLLFAAVFKLLPDVRIRWRDVLVGAAITAVMFLVGKALFEVYISHVAVGSTYGSAGALAILLLFAYYSAQVFLLGGEFTQVYAREIGADIEPKRGAVRVTESELARQSGERKLERQQRAQRRKDANSGRFGTTDEIVSAARYLDKRRSGPLGRWAMFIVALGLGWLGRARRKPR